MDLTMSRSLVTVERTEFMLRWRKVPSCSPEGRPCKKLSQPADGGVSTPGLFIRKDKPFSVHKLIQKFD